MRTHTLNSSTPKHTLPLCVCLSLHNLYRLFIPHHSAIVFFNQAVNSRETVLDEEQGHRQATFILSVNRLRLKRLPCLSWSSTFSNTFCSLFYYLSFKVSQLRFLVCRLFMLPSLGPSLSLLFARLKFLPLSLCLHMWKSMAHTYANTHTRSRQSFHCWENRWVL